MWRSIRSAIVAVFILASSSSASAAEQRTVGLVDGMVIKTSNSWGNVEVRAQSFGPGFCSTEVTVGDKTVIIAAPPLTYSSWIIANSYGGSVTFSISKSDNCDTGTMAQVRYWAD